MRIGGIASGMDTEQIVNDLMKVERLRVDKLFQQEQTIKWRQEAYNDINRKLANFILDSKKNLGLTRTTSTGILLSNSVESLGWVKKVASSDEDALKVTANANAMLGTHTIYIKQLAQAARKTIDVQNIDELKELIDGDKLILTSGTGEDVKTVEIDLESLETMTDLVRAINNAADNNKSLGLRAAFDKDIGLVISTKNTGEDEVFEINFKNDIDPDKIKEVEGKDAIIEFNGKEVKKSSNNFSVLGINLQLEGVSTNPITINVSSDVESVYEKIKSFIDEYNKIIDDITEQINQKFYKDYHPLSNEEKQAMKDRDIELWEEKAKSGLVQNDPTLTRMLQTLRSRLYEKVEGVGGSFDHITQIGITTGRYQDGGKLVIDEQKLKNAINNDPEGVLELLFKTPEGSDENDEKVKNSGLVNRIYDTMVDSMKEIISKSGPGEDAALLRNVRSNILIDFVTEQSSISLLDKDIEKLNQRIIREERILAQREDSYWKRFTAMEKAMAAMQQQSMWLMSQMGFY